MISLICPMSKANTNTPISQAAVMNRYSSVFSGFGFFPEKNVNEMDVSTYKYLVIILYYYC